MKKEKFKAKWIGLRHGKTFDAVRTMIEQYVASMAPVLSVEFVPCEELETLKAQLEAEREYSGKLVEAWTLVRDESKQILMQTEIASHLNACGLRIFGRAVEALALARPGDKK